jgi:hypothetical protein
LTNSAADETKAMMSGGSGFQSILQGLSSGVRAGSFAPSVQSTSSQPIIIYNNITGSVDVDGDSIGRLAFQKIDKFVKCAYA